MLSNSMQMKLHSWTNSKSDEESLFFLRISVLSHIPSCYLAILLSFLFFHLFQGHSLVTIGCNININPRCFSLPALIHSAKPLSRPIVFIVFAHVRPSVRPHFSKSNKIKTFAIGEIVGLAEWINENTCLVLLPFVFFRLSVTREMLKRDVS